MRRSVPTENVWGDIVGYSRAVRVGNLIFVSGTTASGPDGKALHPGKSGPQTRVILDRIEAALKSSAAPSIRWSRPASTCAISASGKP